MIVRDGTQAARVGVIAQIAAGKPVGVGRDCAIRRNGRAVCHARRTGGAVGTGCRVEKSFAVTVQPDHAAPQIDRVAKVQEVMTPCLLSGVPCCSYQYFAV